MLAIQFLGAAGRVTGSKYSVTYGRHKFLVDCGLFQGSEEDSRHNYEALPSPARDYHAVVLTHAHIDHSGLLPRLVAEGFRGDIWCTFPTRDLCDIMLPDSANIQEKEAGRVVPLYTLKDAHKTLDLIKGCDYNRPYAVMKGVTVIFHDAGHLLGSAWLEIKLDPLPDWDIDRPVTLVFSGDVGRGKGPLLEAPEKPVHADFLVLESTYGDHLHSKRPPQDQLADLINRVSDTKTALIIPAFAVQRSQEVATLIEELWKQRRIDSLDLFIDSPMAVRANRVFETYPEFLNEVSGAQIDETGRLLGYRYLTLCESSDQSRAIGSTAHPLIVISASGMAEGGRVLHHLTRYLPNPRAQVLFAGYQCEGTRGWKLLNGASHVEMRHGEVAVRCHINFLEGMSGHADYSELQEWLSELEQPPARTMLVHGEIEVLAAHQARIQRRGWQVEIPKHREQVVLYGASSS